jgi:hypothetical protein
MGVEPINLVYQTSILSLNYIKVFKNKFFKKTNVYLNKKFHKIYYIIYNHYIQTYLVKMNKVKNFNLLHYFVNQFGEHHLIGKDL